MSNPYRGVVDPQILLWNPDLLWARYLEVLSRWRADRSIDKITLPVYSSPKELGEAMRKVLKDAHDPDGLKLRWEILFAFGYDAIDAFLMWARDQTRDATGKMEELVRDYVHGQ